MMTRRKGAEQKTQIYVNGRFLTQRLTGVQRYALELLKALDALLESDPHFSRYSFCLLVPTETAVVPPLKKISVRRVGRMRGQLWEQLELPWYCRGGLLLNMCNVGPALIKDQVVVIHDAAVFIAPAGFSRPFLVWYRLLLPWLCKRSRSVITVSEFSKLELVEHCAADSRKIAVVPNGVDHMDLIETSGAALKKFGLVKGGYVLSVGNLHPNKNFKMVIEVAEKLSGGDVVFVVAGGGNASVFAEANLASEKVRFLGHVSDSELKELYTAAACFLFPSSYEGFGIPPLEAMRCGCPVVASNAASLPEVCGDAAMYAAPDDTEVFVRHVANVLGDEVFMTELAARGIARSDAFRWKSSALKLSGLLDAICT